MKRIFNVFTVGGIWSIALLIFPLGSSAQTAPFTGGVTTATGGIQKQTLDAALGPQTRQTLQAAMDSIDAAGTVSVAAPVMVGPGEGAELDGSSVKIVSFNSLPEPLKAALHAFQGH